MASAQLTVKSNAAIRWTRAASHLLILLPFAACSIQNARIAVDAKTTLVGMSKTELALCAGLPTKTEQLDPVTEMRSYEHKVKGGTINLTFPVIGGVNIGNGSYCHVTFKLVQGRVTSVGYAGDSDFGPGGTDGACTPIVRHCTEQRS